MQERATQKHSILFWDSSELGITATPFGPGCWKIKVARKWMNTQPGYVLIIIFMNNCCYRYLSCFHGRFSFFLFGGSFCFLCLPHYLVIWQFHSVNALISRNNKAGQVNNIHYFVKMVPSKGCVIKHKAGSQMLKSKLTWSMSCRLDSWVRVSLRWQVLLSVSCTQWLVLTKH